MARTKTYDHFCPVARALEVIGEKWSLLIVRDLLRGPQRFGDLLRALGGITPKWLTLRLRELEQAGILVREEQPGRREVWYRLTDAGRELAPVIEALAVWGIDHALRPPLPGEAVHPAHATVPFVTYLNRRGVRLPHPVTWVLRFPPGRSYTIRFDGARWSLARGEASPAADVVVEVAPEEWTAFLTAEPGERRERLGRMRITGAPERVQELTAAFGRPGPHQPTAPPEAAAPPSSAP